MEIQQQMTTDICIYSATLIYLTNCIFSASIRWFHMCHPFDQHADYFYPARRVLTVDYLIPLMLIPTLFYGTEPDSSLLLHSFFAIFYPASFSLLFRTFFSFTLPFSIRHLLQPISALVYLLVLSVLVLIPEQQTEAYYPLLKTASVVIALGSLAHQLVVMRRLDKRIKEFYESQYSNDDNFPAHFAKQMLVGATTISVLTLLPLFVHHASVLIIIMLLFSILQTYFLLIFLHPHRKGATAFIAQEHELEVEDAVLKETQEKADAARVASEHKEAQLYEKLLPRIDKVLVEDKLYLKPNLTIADVATAIGSNRTYTSMVFNKAHGSFLNYVNKLRIEHVLRLREEHADWKQNDIYLSSGFNTRASYIKWMNIYMENLPKD